MRGWLVDGVGGWVWVQVDQLRLADWGAWRQGVRVARRTVGGANTTYFRQTGNYTAGSSMTTRVPRLRQLLPFQRSKHRPPLTSQSPRAAPSTPHHSSARITLASAPCCLQAQAGTLGPLLGPCCPLRLPSRSVKEDALAHICLKDVGAGTLPPTPTDAPCRCCSPPCQPRPTPTSTDLFPKCLLTLYLIEYFAVKSQGTILPQPVHPHRMAPCNPPLARAGPSPFPQSLIRKFPHVCYPHASLSVLSSVMMTAPPALDLKGVRHKLTGQTNPHFPTPLAHPCPRRVGRRLAASPGPRCPLPLPPPSGLTVTWIESKRYYGTIVPPDLTRSVLSTTMMTAPAATSP